MKELCRVCASELRGTRRRWIFGSGSPLDLRAVLSHVLGRAVRRGDGRGEFVCGKCAAALERVYRYDGVIVRVQALSLQKVHSLLGQRDRLSQCLRHLHAQSGPEGAADPPGPQYEALLQQGMALSAYECWSEGSVSRVCMCPGRVCSGCSALRVSEAVYESVCGFPRSLAYSRLSRDKSRSVPLSLGSPEEMAGSWRGGAEGPPLSDGGWPRSRSLSASSLGPPPSSGPYSDEEESELEERGDRSQVLSATLESLRGIMYRSVPATPGHSRIPVLSRRGTAPALGGWETPGEHPTKESLLDVDKDFSPEYLPFDLQKFLEHKPAHDGTQQRVTELGEQLEEARQLDGPVSSDQEVQTQPKHGQETYSQCRMIQWLTAELHSKGQLYQRTLKLLVQLLSGTSPAADVKADLVEMLRARLKERDEQLQRVAEENFAAVEEMVSEAEGLRRAVRHKDQDVRRLGEVITRNEEIIHMLSRTLKMKDTAVEQLEAQYKSLKEVGSKRDTERVASLHEKDRIISQLQVTLKHSSKDIEALTHSVLSRGLSRGSQTDSEAEPGSVALRLKEKDNLLVQVLVDQERQAARHQQTTEQLLNCVMERDRVIQELSDSHREAAADLAEQLQALQAQLSARDRELAERRGLQAAAAQECFSELASMRALLEHKDQLILDLLDGGRERDQLLSCLQQHVTEGTLLKVTMKHTL